MRVAGDRMLHRIPLVCLGYGGGMSALRVRYALDMAVFTVGQCLNT